MADAKLLDLSQSNLQLEGDKKTQDAWNKKINGYIDDLKEDVGQRRLTYQKRHDFYTGNQGDYTNIIGQIKDSKQKKGHTNQVVNYAGKTTAKIAFSLANNPPKLSITPDNITDELEETKAQAVENYIDSVFKENRFYNNAYRRGCFIQSEYGDAAIKTFPLVTEKKIKIVLHANMGSLLVGWNGNPGEYDFVIAENYLTGQKIFDDYGILVDEKLLEKTVSTNSQGSGSWNADPVDTWGTKSTTTHGKDILPSGKSKLAKLKVIEFDSASVYAIQIEGELVQLVFKDDSTFPKQKFWTIIHNVPNPPSEWSIADIDYLMDAQIELNDNDNRSSDHLRVGNVQRYVAYNMNDFDPASIKTSSGQVIFVNDPDGKSRFEPLPTNINNFPDDQYYQRKMNQMYDMGLPRVSFGVSSAYSGRSKVVDYQSSVELTDFKRDSWELALQDICDKIQIFGNFLLGETVDWFGNDQGEFITRIFEYDWSDIVPSSESEKIVNVANKVNMIGLPLDEAFKELGYRNPQALIQKLKNELADPQLMILRSKMWQLSAGLIQAQNEAMMAQQQNGMGAPDALAPGGAPVNQTPPVLSPGTNQNTPQPMANKTGTTATSTPTGIVSQMQQNMAARGG